MKKCRRTLAAEQTGKLDLAAGRIEQILAAYDEIHVLQPVVDDDGELIRPVAVPIADEQIAALFGGPLLLRPEPKIVEPLDRGIQPDPDTQRRRTRQIPCRGRFRDNGPAPTSVARALARVRQSALAQIIERALVHRAALALPGQLPIGREPEPREVFEQRRLELRAASSAIVIFDAQQHTSVRPACARDIPYINGVEDVPEVEITGRGRGEPW